MHAKKVLFINRCFWPDSEATGQLLTELCEFLAERWGVSALVGQPNWDTESDEFVKVGDQVRNQVQIHRLAHSQLPKSQRFARIRNLISFTLAVRKWGGSRLEAGGGRREERQSKGDARGALNGGQPGLAPDGLGQTAASACGSGGVREIIVCETDPFLLPLVVGPMARRRNARLVYYLQDIYPDVAVAVGVAKNNFFIRALRNRLKKEYLKAEAIIVLDEDMRDRLVGWGIRPEQLRIVPNWMDCSVVRPVKSNNPFRLQHGVNDQFVVMHSGNMGMTQRLDVLVEAWKRGSRLGSRLEAGGERLEEKQSADGACGLGGGKPGLAPDGSGETSASACGSGETAASACGSWGNEAVLMLVGNGAKRKPLEQQASGIESIRFLDYQPREKLGESLSAADLHVVSMDEAITGCLAPSKLYGILASGTPVLAIVPKNNAVWRLVESERLGWCVEPGDQIGIVNAVHDARSRSSSELQDMGARGRALAEKLFDKNVCCSSFEEVIDALA